MLTPYPTPTACHSISSDLTLSQLCTLRVQGLALSLPICETGTGCVTVQVLGFWGLILGPWLCLSVTHVTATRNSTSTPAQEGSLWGVFPP